MDNWAPMLQLHINMLSTDDVDSMIGLIAKLMNGLIQYIYPSKSVPQYIGTYFIQVESGWKLAAIISIYL